jgi:hypothetical protein
MATVLKDGLIAGSATVAGSEGDEAVFQEIVDQLVSHRQVRLDSRRFTEISVDGPGWTYTNDWYLRHFALRLTAGQAVFDCGFGHDNRVELKTDSWLYVPLHSDFRVTTGRASSDYPCVFIVAQLVAE